MDVCVNRKRFSKLKTYVFLLITLSLMAGPAYAETRIDTMDLDTEETLSGQEDVDHSRFHGHLGGEINYAKGNRNGAHYRGRLVAPLFRVEYDEWVYVTNAGGGEAGVWLWQTPDHMRKMGVSVQGHPNRTAFDIMGRRKASTDGVINIHWRTPENYFIHLNYFRDIGNVSNGDSVALSFSRHIIFPQGLFNHPCLLIPSIALEWESTRLVDYYYGVRPEEATPDRPVYAGRDTVNGGARLTGFYLINKSWTVFAGVHAAVFGRGIAESPIVTRRYTTRGYIGSAWLF